MMSWLCPPNRSARLSFPFGPSKTYFFSTFSHGISRRSRLSSSRRCVNSLSLANSFLRASSHAAGETSFWFVFPVVAVVISHSFSTFVRSLFSLFFLRRTFTSSAVTPPPETTLPATIAALATHAGHMDASLSGLGFRSRLNSLIEVGPPRRHSFAMFFLNHAEGFVMELDQGLAVFLAQAILQVGAHRIGHEQRPDNFEQRGTLDGLHMSPQVAVTLAQIAEPASARPGLEHHRHFLFWRLVRGSQLLEQRGKGRFHGRSHVNFLRHREGQAFNSWHCWRNAHVFLLKKSPVRRGVVGAPGPGAMGLQSARG